MDEVVHQHSRDEIQKLFIEKIWHFIAFIERAEPEISRRHAMENTAFLVLQLLDGGYYDLPKFAVLPAEGGDGFPALQIDHDYDIAGNLHEVFLHQGTYKEVQEKILLATATPLWEMYQISRDHYMRNLTEWIEHWRGAAVIEGRNRLQEQYEVQKICMNLIDMGWRPSEATKFLEVCKEMARTSPLSVAQIADNLYRQITSNYTTKEEIIALWKPLS